jgi:hypothetical protein
LVGLTIDETNTCIDLWLILLWIFGLQVTTNKQKYLISGGVSLFVYLAFTHNLGPLAITYIRGVGV